MPLDGLYAVFRRDLDRLPGLPDDEWVPGPRRSAGRIGIRHALAAFGILLVAIAIGLSLQSIRSAQPGDDAAVGTPQEQFFIEAQAGTLPSASPIPALAGPPQCPRGQAPWLRVDSPPPPGTLPGTGVAGPDAAFRRARPTASAFTMFKWGDPVALRGPDDPRISSAPVWIVAGDETFVATVIGGPPYDRSWFAYPATFMGCRTLPSPTRITEPRP